MYIQNEFRPRNPYKSIVVRLDVRSDGSIAGYLEQLILMPAVGHKTLKFQERVFGRTKHIDKNIIMQYRTGAIFPIRRLVISIENPFISSTTQKQT